MPPVAGFIAQSAQDGIQHAAKNRCGNQPAYSAGQQAQRQAGGHSAEQNSGIAGGEAQHAQNAGFIKRPQIAPQQLKKAGIINVKRGSGGAYIEKPLDKITLLDVYNAVECIDNGNLFHFHENPNSRCPVGRNIHSVLDRRLDSIQQAMEREMSSVTLQDIADDTDRLINM